MNRRVRPRRPINDDTGLKKLMRYARRGKLPPERMQIIKRAQENAAKCFHLYLNRPARRAAEALARGPK